MAWQTALFNNILSDLLFNMASKANLCKAYNTCICLFSTIHVKILLTVIEDVSILYLRFFGVALSVKLFYTGHIALDKPFCTLFSPKWTVASNVTYKYFVTRKFLSVFVSLQPWFGLRKESHSVLNFRKKNLGETLHIFSCIIYPDFFEVSRPRIANELWSLYRIVRPEYYQFCRP